MQALYRKYRSQSLDDIVGQRHVTDILKAEIANNNLSQAYLFVGPRGVGKTSVARILAHEINKLPYELEANHVDIIEFNAADKTSVDDIRDIIDRASVAPNYASHKVYIIDEVHMLSKAAFNAFLKILEEPPKHVVFILATTDHQKIPATIVSRTQKFSFRRISALDIAKHLQHIAKQEKISVSQQVIESIAAKSDGGLRDAINLLDQVSNLTLAEQGDDTIELILGIIPQTEIDEIIDNYLAGNLSDNITLIDKLINTSFQPSDIARQLANTAKKQLHQQPKLIHLIRDLASIDNSHNPDLRIILALGRTFNADLPPAKPTIKKQIAQVAPTAKTSDQPPAPTIEAASPEIVSTEPEVDFDLAKLCQQADPKLAELINKANVELDGDQLTLTGQNGLAQSRLASKKSQIAEILAQNNYGHLQLTINKPKLGSPKPKTNNLDSIKQLMGGGEEVSL